MNSNHLPEEYRGNPDFIAIQIPRKMAKLIVENLREQAQGKPFTKVGSMASVLSGAIWETETAEEKVKQRIERQEVARMKIHKDVCVSVRSMPVISVCASSHGSFGLDAQTREAETTLRENLRFTTPLWDDYSGRNLVISHSIYCG